MHAAVMHGHTGRIVAAVLELAQAFDQDRDDVAVGDRGDDAAHGYFFFWGRFQPGTVSCLTRVMVSLSGGASW
jgi:hypothetical protein